MSGSRGTLAALAAHLAAAVAPLQAIFSDDRSFSTTIARLGWTVSAVPASYAAVAAAAGDAAKAADSLGDGASLADAVALLEDVGALYAALESMDEAPAGVQPGAFLAELPRALFDYLLADYLALELPGVMWPLRALGVVSYEPVNASDGRPAFVRTRIDWERLPRALRDPAAVPTAAFAWGTREFDFDGLLNIAGGVLDGLGIPTSVDRVDPALAAALEAQATGTPERPVVAGFTVVLFDDPALQSLEPIGVSVVELPAEAAALPGIVVLPKLPSGLASEVDVGGGWTFTVRAGTDLAEQLGVVVRPGETAVRYPFSPGQELPDAGFGASLGVASDPSRLLLGEPDGIRVELASATFSLELDADGAGLELTVGVDLGGLALVLSPGSVDSFLASIIGDSDVRVDVPFGLSWSSRTGVGLASDTGFALSLYPEIAVGGVRVDRVDLGLALSTGTGGELALSTDAAPELALSATAAIAAALGPVSFAADGLGAELPLRLAPGNAGPFDVSFGFVLPTGLGLGVDVDGVVSGGGFLDVDAAAQRYAGIGELGILGVELVATGVIVTGISAGWSMFFSLAAKFTGVQLGFGFTLNGVGGLVGIDRGLDDTALGDAARTGSLDAILYPKDPIADAALILDGIDQIFPPRPGQYVFGPIVQIGWGTPTLVQLDMAVALQLPEPLTVSLLGALSSVLPTADVPILELHANFAGTVNLTEGTLAVDASLTGSRVAGLLITGDMAARAAFLDAPTFLIAFGGFHPAFPPPAGFPDLARVGFSLDAGDALRITLGGYFAVASNSVQVGARADLWAGGEGFTVEGGTSFDTILMWDPFAFAVGLSVWTSVTAAGADLLGVMVTGKLSGPNPWAVCAQAQFRLLGIQTGFEIDADIGDAVAETPPDKVDLSQLVRDALSAQDAWSALSPAGPDPVLVVDSDGELALHPSGRAQVLQHLVPLEVELDRYGEARIDGSPSVSVRGAGSASADAEDALDYFAGAQYFALTAQEQLSAPSFELMKAGVIIGGSGADAPEPREAVFDYEVVYRDPVGRDDEDDPGKPFSARDEAMTRALGVQAAAPGAVRYTVTDPAWTVTDPDSGRPTGAVPVGGTGYFEARSALNGGPSVVIPTYEAELTA